MKLFRLFSIGLLVLAVLFALFGLIITAQAADQQTQDETDFVWVKFDWGMPGKSVITGYSQPQQQVQFDFVTQDGFTGSFPWILSEETTSIEDLRGGFASQMVEVSITPSRGGYFVSTWNESVCPNGPMFLGSHTDLNEVWVYMYNSTGQDVYAIVDTDSEWTVVEEGYSFNRDALLEGFMMVKNSLSGEPCGTLSWDWLEEKTVSISIGDAEGVQGQQISLPVMASNIQGLQGLMFVLNYNSEVIGDIEFQSFNTLTENALKFETQQLSNNSMKVLIALTQPITTDAGLMFNISAIIQTSNGQTAVGLSEVDLSPKADVSLKSGSVVGFQGHTLDVTVKDYWNTPVWGTQFTLTGQGIYIPGIVDENAEAHISGLPKGTYEISFTHEDKWIGIEDIDYTSDCLLGRKACYVPVADTQLNGVLDMDDLTCDINVWLGNKFGTCRAGEVVYQPNPWKGDLTGDMDLQILSFVRGDVVPYVMSAVAAAAASPEIEYTGQFVSGQDTEITIKVNDSLKTAGFVLSHSDDLQVISVTSDLPLYWYEDRLIILADNMVQDATITIKVRGNADSTFGISEFHTPERVWESLPSLKLGELEEMPILRVELFLPALHR